jgi:uncharacterized protein (TIGR02145 family)
MNNHKILILVVTSFIILINSCDDNSTSIKNTSDNVISDIDGNEYKIIKIGDQWWMAENLKVTRYNNGDSILNFTDSENWENSISGSVCSYDNKGYTANVYGRLYNWYAIEDSRKIAPEGWHIPSDAEWKELEINLGMSQSEASENGNRGIGIGGKLKSDGIQWVSPNVGATDSVGFSALGSGLRMPNGSFVALLYSGIFWTSNQYEFSDRYAMYRHLDTYNSTIHRSSDYKQYGFSIRCVKD